MYITYIYRVSPTKELAPPRGHLHLGGTTCLTLLA